MIIMTEPLNITIIISFHPIVPYAKSLANLRDFLLSR